MRLGRHAAADAVCLLSVHARFQMVAVLLTLQNEDATKPVQIYFNCPGGEVRPLARL
jgi:ATP-dependent protease ClpP protease subunit